MIVPPFPGQIRQASFVVADIDQAIGSWLQLGVGPWFLLRNLSVVGSWYRGQPSDPSLALAFANSGELQFELIQPLDQSPSIYREFLDSCQPGFHHIAYWTTDLDAAAHNAQLRGWECVQSAAGNFEYYEVGGDSNLVVEVMHLTPRMQAITAAIREAAFSWDGVEQPVRSYPP